MCHADIANLALLFPLSQRNELSAPIHQIMNLHQIHALRAQALERLLHLADTRLAPTGPHFGRKEKSLTRIELSREIADDVLGSPVHRRGIHDATAEPHEFADDLTPPRALGFRWTNIEGLPGPQTDDRQPCAGSGD